MRSKDAKLTNFVFQFCDHKADCTNAMCQLQPTSEVIPEDVAYRDERFCEKFRHTDGGVGGALIIETGVWK